MGLAIHAAAAALLVAVLAGAPALAEEWAVSGSSAGALYETDVASLVVKDQLVKSWVRESLVKPARDEQTRKMFVTTLTQRSDDCERRQFAMGEYVRRDGSGQTVASGAGGGGWHAVIPGSVAEAIWRTNCATVHPPKPEPLLQSISAGTWRSLGQSADKKYFLSVKTDEVIKVDDQFVLSFERSDYAKPEWIDGYAVRFIVTASVVDCVNEKSAGAGVDAYVSPSLRVNALRVDRDALRFEPLAPGSFLGKNLREVCAAGRAVKAGSEGEGEESGLSSGTAWGVSKGYLVTAAHVIVGGKRIEVYRDGERVGEARVVLADRANDLAVLKFSKAPAGKLKVLNLADKPAALGRNIFTVGYPAPDALGQKVKMTAGQVSGTTGYRDDTRFLQISVPIQGGNSGGPVMGWDGTVVGVVDSKLTRFGEDDDQPPPEDVNYAVKASYVRPMLEDLPDLGNYEVVKTGADQEAMVEQVRAAVFMLVVTH